MTVVPMVSRPPAWPVLAQAICERQTVWARYRGVERVLCPHALGWKKGRPKLLAFQVTAATSHGPLPAKAEQRWRSMFVDELEAAAIADDPWQSADNYRLASSNCFDTCELAVAIS